MFWVSCHPAAKLPCQKTKKTHCSRDPIILPVGLVAPLPRHILGPAPGNGWIYKYDSGAESLFRPKSSQHIVSCLTSSYYIWKQLDR